MFTTVFQSLVANIHVRLLQSKELKPQMIQQLDQLSLVLVPAFQYHGLRLQPQDIRVCNAPR